MGSNGFPSGPRQNADGATGTACNCQRKRKPGRAPPPGQAEFGVLKHLRALNYSRLAVFLTTDELCTFHSSKVRAAEWIFTQYYHHRLEHVDPSKVYYLPTGQLFPFVLLLCPSPSLCHWMLSSSAISSFKSKVGLIASPSLHCIYPGPTICHTGHIG